MPNPFEQLSVADLRRRTSIKWREYPADVLPLWVAEMDVLVAPPIVAAVEAALRAGDTGYPYGTAYAEALAGFAHERWKWELPVERSAIVPDVMLGIVEMLKLVTDPGDPVIINSPVYQPFYQFIAHMDRQVVEAPLNADHRIDLETMERTFTEAARGSSRAAYLLCSPHNPTGTVHTSDELRAVTALAAAHEVRVVADEIHAPVVPSGAEHVPYLSVEGAERAFSLMSASKGWNLAGLKAAVALAGPDAAQDLARMPEEVTHGHSHVGAIAHIAALREGVGWLDEMLVGLDSNRRLLGELLAQLLPEIRYRPPDGTYLAWLDCRALGLGDDPAARFLERGRVALSAGPLFGTGGAGHVRLNLATSSQILSEAVRRMAGAV